MLNKCKEYFDPCKQVWRIQIKPRNNNRLDVARFYYNEGTMYHGTGNDEKAVKFYEKALGIRKETLRENSQYIADTLRNLALTYAKRGNYEKAKEMSQKIAMSQANNEGEARMLQPNKTIAVAHFEKYNT